jgi:hypothetical protein
MARVAADDSNYYRAEPRSLSVILFHLFLKPPYGYPVGGFRRLWAAKSGLFTDWWPRERKAVFDLTHSREMEGTSNDKTQETKTAGRVQGDRYDRTGGFDRNYDL